MEQGAAMPSRGGLASIYPYLPHAKVDAMDTASYDMQHYKSAMTCAMVLFLCTLVEFACPFKGLTWYGITYFFLFAFPYLGIIGSPAFFFLYTILAMLFTFINFIMNVSSDCPLDGVCRRYSCWGVAVFIELPMLVTQALLLNYLRKTDSNIAAKLASCTGGGKATPTMTTHSVGGMVGPGMAPQLAAPGSQA